MPNIIKNFPFTSLLGIFGFFVGLFLLSILDFSISTNYGLDPVDSFITYFKGSLDILFKGVGLGVAVGLALGFAGFIIDISRKKPDPNISGPMPVQ